MVGSLASINILFRADLNKFSSEMQNASRQLKRQGEQMKRTGESLSLYVSAPLLAAGAASIKTFGDIEALDKGLISVMGSAEAAAAEFERLKEVAKLPGLGLEEAVRGSVNLQAAGFSADEARAALLAFGNALATVGKGARELDLVTLALTQLNNKSGGFGQDLRQLTEQLPQLRGALQAAFGTVDTDKISRSGVTGKQVVQALTAEFAKLPKVTGGINNAIENSTDNLKVSFAQLGDTINKAFDVEGLLDSFGESIKDIAQAFSEMEPATQKIILSVAGLAAATGPLLVGLGGIVKIIPLIATGWKSVTAALASTAAISGPLLAAVAAIGAAYLVYDRFANSTKQLTAAKKDEIAAEKLLKTVYDEATNSVAQQRLKLEQLVVTARNLTLPLKERETAIAAINKISPEYLGNITTETIRTDAATAAINKYNEALFKGAMARAAQAKLDDNARRRIDAQLKLEQQVFEYNQKRVEAEKQGWDASVKFFNENNANMAMANHRYEDKVKLLDKEDEQLAGILKGNTKYLELINNIGTASEGIAGDDAAKAGTIKYYESLINEAKKLQTETVTTSAAYAKLEEQIAGYQAKIDALQGKRIKVTSVFEGVTLAEPQSEGTIEAYDAQIANLRRLQSEVATTSETYAALNRAILELELEKEVKFDLPVDTLLDAAEGARVFGQNYSDAMVMAQVKSEEFANAASIMGQAMGTAFTTLANGIVGSMDASASSMERFLAALASNIAGVISQLLGQAIANSVVGATQSANATGPGAAVSLPAFLASALGAVFAAFAAIPSFATGGIMPGNSYTGDKLFARINSGEMILNQRQQANLMGMLNPAVSAGDVAIQLMGGFEVDGAKLRLVLDRTDKIKNRTS